MDERDLAKVEAAFETLLEVVGRECDAETAWTVECARVDVLAILSGEWSDVAMRERCAGGDAPDEDGPRRMALRAIFASDFDAAITLLWPDVFETVARVRDEIALTDWWPSPVRNEAMLAALETYREKRAGALGRGASRLEAETFALMEARRVYRQLVWGGS